MRAGRVTLGDLNILAYSHLLPNIFGILRSNSREIYSIISAFPQMKETEIGVGVRVLTRYFPVDTAHASCTHFIGRIGRISLH